MILRTLFVVRCAFWTGCCCCNAPRGNGAMQQFVMISVFCMSISHKLSLEFLIPRRMILLFFESNHLFFIEDDIAIIIA